MRSLLWTVLDCFIDKVYSEPVSLNLQPRHTENLTEAEISSFVPCNNIEGAER